MSELIPLSQNTSSAISSLEIAAMTGKRHADVLRDIRTMLENLGEGTGRSFASSYKDPTGRDLPEFQLPKRESLCLAAGYDAKLRMKIIDRWAELEGVRPVLTPSLAEKSAMVLAVEDISAVMTPLNTLFKGMGLTKAERTKVYVEHAMIIGPKHGVGNSLIPAHMAKYLPTAGTASTVAMASTGGTLVDVTALGRLLGYSAEQVNAALVYLKFQAKVKLGSTHYFVKLPAADAIADEKLQGPKRLGGYKPTKVIKGWRENLVYPHLQAFFTKFPGGNPL